MGRKIFVSYKYWDTDVKPLPHVGTMTKVRDYVNYIEDNIIDPSDNIYKGKGETRIYLIKVKTTFGAISKIKYTIALLQSY